MEFSLHPFTESHGNAFAKLARQSPDGGEATVTVQFKLNGYTVYRALRSDMMGVVAVSPDHEGIVGIGTMSSYDMMINGKLRKTVLLSALMVHPDARRQGVASALAQWRVDKARELYGDDVVIYAGIQKGNIGSFKNAQKWSNQLLENVSVLIPHRSTDQAPEPNASYTIRKAQPSEYQAFVDSHNAFYQDHQLFQPMSVEKLQAKIDHTPFAHPINTVYGGTDSDGNIVAGMVFTNVYELYDVHVKAPFFEGTSTLASVSHYWYAPDHASALKYLWDTILYERHQDADRIRINIDPRSPVHNLLGFEDVTERSPNAFVFASDEPLDETKLFASHF